MSKHTVRTFLELSPSQETAIEADVDLNAALDATTLMNVQAPEGMTRVEVMHFNANRDAVQRTQTGWNFARRAKDAAKTEAARKAFVAALLACGVPAKVSL